MAKREWRQLSLAADCLLVFIDETGHETFAGDQNYYGLGGCALMVGTYDVLKARWKEVRKIVNGDPEAPLHAAQLFLSKEHYDCLSKFFGDLSFARLAVTSTSLTRRPADMHAAKPVVEVLKKQIVSVASFSPFKSLALVFESSDRTDPLIAELFGALELEEDGAPILVDQCFMPKSVAEPGLEIADFIVNAAASETRRRVRGTTGFAKDFQAAFHQVPETLTRFMTISEVSRAAAPAPSLAN